MADGSDLQSRLKYIEGEADKLRCELQSLPNEARAGAVSVALLAGMVSYLCKIVHMHLKTGEN